MTFIYIVVGIENSLRAGRYEDRFLEETRYSSSVQADLGAHPAFCKKSTSLFPGGKAAGEWR